MEDMTPCPLYTAINVGLRCQRSRIQFVTMNNENCSENSEELEVLTTLFTGLLRQQ